MAVELIVQKEQLFFSYGYITEIYSPAFREPEVNQNDKEQVTLPSVILQKLGFSKKEIWKNITDKKKMEAYHIYWYASIIEQIRQTINGIMGPVK